MISKSLTREGPRTSALLKYIRATWGEHCFAVKIHGSAFQPRVIDILCSFYGLFVALEVKRPGKHPTPRQQKTIRDIGKSGGFVAVVWSNSDVKTFFDWVLDRVGMMTYSGDTRADALAPTRERKRSITMPTTKSKAKPAKTSKRSKAVVEDEDDDLDDLEDLDDLDDFVDDDEDDEDEDEDEDDEEEDEEPEPVVTRRAKRAANDAKAAKAKAATKPSPVKTTKTAAKTPAKTKAVKGEKKGAPSTRALGDGFIGAQDLASEFGVDGRAVRLYFRKNDTPKNADGRYAWKEGSRELTKLRKELKAQFS